MNYNSGIWENDCSQYDYVNHGMAAVGYGYDSANQVEYAIIRNSWGTYWGEDGHVRVKIGSDDPSGGACQLYQYGSYPLIA